MDFSAGIEPYSFEAEYSKPELNKHEILISPAGEREREKIKNFKKIKKKKN